MILNDYQIASESAKKGAIEPCLFHAIADEVASSLTEQYLIAFREGGVKVMVSTPAVEIAISKLTSYFKSGRDIIAFESNTSDFVSSNVRSTFSDNFQGVLDRNGILIEVSVRKLQDGVYRVLFSRINARQMYFEHSARLKKMENLIEDLFKQQLNIFRDNEQKR